MTERPACTIERRRRANLPTHEDKVVPSELLELPALYERLRPGERLLWPRPGAQTVGLALSDVMRQIATPLETIRRTKFKANAERLLHLAKEHGVGGLVVGLPINLDGTRSRARNRPAPSSAIWASSPNSSRYWDDVFDRSRRARAARSRRQPKTPRRADRQDGRRLHPAGRARPPQFQPPHTTHITPQISAPSRPHSSI